MCGELSGELRYAVLRCGPRASPGRIRASSRRFPGHDWTLSPVRLGLALPGPARWPSSGPLGMAAREELYSKVTPRRHRQQRPGTIKHGSALDVLLSMGFPRARA